MADVVNIRNSDLSKIKSFADRVIFDLPDLDLRDVAGLDSHSYRGMLMKFLTEIAEFEAEPTSRWRP